MVNHYYIYAVDRDFGPFFLKFCSYFPFNADFMCAPLGIGDRMRGFPPSQTIVRLAVT